MKIVVDAFGGDNAPLEVIKGCRMAADEFGVQIMLSGNESIIKKLSDEHNISMAGIEVTHAETVIDIHEDPGLILKGKSDCSMAAGLRLLAEGKGDAFISAGSTGALVMGATFITKRIKGIKRPALAPIMPTATGHMILMDAGANMDCRPDALVQFGIMGSCYMKTVMGIESPKVGLVNVGSEDTKGRELEIEAFRRFKSAPVNFYGNLEARDIPSGKCEVVVTDGFTGNVALKLYEGMGSFFSHTLKDMLSGSLGGKIAALLILPKIKEFKKKMDYTEVGGGVLMGISKPVLKAHGSSNAKAFFNAVRQAKKCIDGNFVEEIRNALLLSAEE